MEALIHQLTKAAALLAVAAGFLGGPPHARGAVIGTCDEESLLEAIQSGGTHTLGCSGAIALSEPIQITNTLVLGATGDVQLRPTGTARIFEVASTGSLTLSNLTLAGGRSTNGGGGAIFSRGTVVLLSCTLSNNVATGLDGRDGRDSAEGETNGGDGQNGGRGQRIAGGAVYSLGRFHAVESGFYNNQASGGNGGTGGAGHDASLVGGDGGDGGDGGGANGGAIFHGGRLPVTMTIVRCGFYENVVQGGDAAEGGAAGNARFPGVIGRGGRGGVAAGGAIYITNKSSALIVGSTFSENRVLSGQSASGGSSSNSGLPGESGPAAYGGGVCNYGTAVVLNSTFHANEIQAGNAGDGADAALKAGDGGDGGIAWGGNLFNAGSSGVTNCTFYGGLAHPGTNGLPGQGRSEGKSGHPGRTRGANIGHAKGKFILSHTILTNIPAATDLQTNTTITTITNIITNIERGTKETNADEVVCTHITVTRSDGFVVQDTVTCETNNIIRPNPVERTTVTSTTNTAVVSFTEDRSNVYGSIKDGGYNLVSDRSIKLSKKKDTKTRLAMDPMLGPLADNGGPTETMELLDGSPAIDEGSPDFSLKTDQRGALRPAGEAGDIGAYEYDGEIVDPPSIRMQPVDNIVDAGSAASFLVVADGTPPLSYQWYRGPRTAVPNASAALLTLPQAMPGDAGDYFVVVTNAAGAVTSVVATLTVRAAAPAITADLANADLYRGENAVFTFQTTGVPTPFVQWFFNGTNRLAGVSGATLSLTNVQPAQAGTYQAVATNLFGSVTSQVATLTVMESPPVIVSEPADFSGYSGATVTLTFQTVGGPVPVYRWLYNGTNLVGATGATVRLTNAQPTGSGTYQAIATNEFGSVTSRVATVSIVDSAPRVVQAPPASTNLAAGTTLVLAVVVDGSLPMTFQWYFTDQSSNTSPIPGATDATLTLPNFQAANEGLYTLEMNNPFGNVFSDSFRAQLPLAAPARR